MTGSHRAVVVGGSICGLTTALTLRDSGWDVVLYERSKVPLEGRGAGIVVHPMTVRYLVEKAGIPVDRFTIAVDVLRYVGRDGATVFEEQLPHLFTSWSALYDNLRACLGNDVYRLGHSVTGIETDDSGAVVELGEGGERVAADLVVCADGIGSTGRSLLMPGVRATYAGYVGWRGTIAAGELDPAAFEELTHAIVYCVLPMSQILVYPIPTHSGERVLNWVWYRNAPDGDGEMRRVMTDEQGTERSLSVPPGMVPDALVAELRSSAEATLPPLLAGTVISTPEPFVQKIVDVEVPNMVVGRVCLAGDAAFAARPHAAAGSAKAAADAWALAEELSMSDGAITGALRRWERRQLALGRLVVDRSREMGERCQVRQTWFPEDRSLRFGLLGPGR
jgi:2,6-dihydroxypyridine 3-monooxygenase